MPATETGGNKPPDGSVLQSTGSGVDLVDTALGDGDLSSLTLPSSVTQFSSCELETFANIQAELDRFNPVSLELGSVVSLSSEGESVDPDITKLRPQESGFSEGSVLSGHDNGTIINSGIELESHGSHDRSPSPESILPDLPESVIVTPDVDMQDLEICSQDEPPVVPRTTVSDSDPKAPSTSSSSPSIVVIQQPTSSVTTSAGGHVIGKLTSICSTMPQFTPVSQTLVTAKSADGNIVQLRPIMSTGQSSLLSSSTSTNIPSGAFSSLSGIALGAVHGIKPLQSTIKRPAGASGQVITKVIITGNPNAAQSHGQPVMLTSAQTEAIHAGQPIKIISGQPSVATLLGSPTKAITLQQAQQMGLLSPAKVQQIIPSSPNKQSIYVNKVLSPVKTPTKIAMLPATIAKSPAKILPAPTSGSQLKPGVSVATVSTINSTNTANTSAVKTLITSPQKVIIRQGPGGSTIQGSLKPGTILTTASGANQVIRIPASQNIVGSTTNLHQIQVPGRQLQYVRFVSASPQTSTTGVTTTVKPATVVPVTVTKAIVPSSSSQTHAVKMVPIAPATQTVKAVVPKSATGQQTQRILIPASAPVSQIRSSNSGVATIPVSAVSQLTPTTTILPSGTNVGNIFMLPAQYLTQLQNQQNQQSLLNNQTRSSSNSNVESSQSSRTHFSNRTTIEPNGIRPRKPCNCTKSQCLKLYCDCFANGEFCNMCNCTNCYNNLDHEEERQRAIKACLERNPQAFRPKIGKGSVGDERRHNKGCNCKRSGCLKNYCECYEAKIPCSSICKCIGCRNFEESSEKKTLRDLADAAEVRVQQQTAVKNKLSAQIQDTISFRPQPIAPSGARQPFSFMTQEVVEATCQCLLAQAEEAERAGHDDAKAERMVLEEFGRCLVQIIECARKTEASSAPVTGC